MYGMSLYTVKKNFSFAFTNRRQYTEYVPIMAEYQNMHTPFRPSGQKPVQSQQNNVRTTFI